MGREVRKVPPDWDHPKEWILGRYQFRPLHGSSYARSLADWEHNRALWAARTMPYVEPGDYENETFESYYGERPDPDDYMPDWPDSERTHYQMYEDTSEGTPISPVFPTPEELARWLVDSKASAFAEMTADYESWLRVCRGGFAPSAMLVDGVLRDGVSALKAK